MKTTIHRYRCLDCPHRAIYLGSVPKKVPGAYLSFGTAYCKAGKKIRAFKRKDPKVYPPSWCPKLKEPAEYRVYAFKDTNTWYLRQLFRETGDSYSPIGSDYAVRAEGHTDLTARSFLEDTESQYPSDVLGIRVHEDEVVEIDDGLKPYFFHITAGGVEVLAYFRSEAAQKNRYEGANDP